MAWSHSENRYHDDKVFDACGLFGFIDTSGLRHSGAMVATALCNMKERGNGLGAGYAGYGIYPDFANYYAFHVMCRNESTRKELDGYLRRYFAVIHDEPIPTQIVPGILDPPVVWRYFLVPQSVQMVGRSEEDYIVFQVMRINSTMEGSFVVSSGKNMGIFKGVGHPDQIAQFYRIDEYDAYLWSSHTRFPTNTPGWWGGAHPFGLLDWSVVHNGEISSYGTNRRYLEMHDYKCTMGTDTEVMAYAADHLMRRHKLPPRMAAQVMASTFWDKMDYLSDKERHIQRAIRQTYAPLLMNGPFAIILARNGEMMGLGDRIHLRPMAAGAKDSILFISSELAAIHLVEPNIDHVWTPEGGDPVIGRLNEPPQIPASLLRLRQRMAQEVSHV
jgi:glutamate synthase domain-containing protein 1